MAAIWAKKPPSPQYAPASRTSRARRASSVPSLRAPVVSSITTPSRRWPTAKNSSCREKTSFTGRRAARASAATCASKWKSHFAPKPPPRSGTTTLTWDSGIPSVYATPARATYGTWVEDHPVALPLRHDRPRLDRHALRRVGDVAAADHDIGRLECRVHVALHDRGEAEHVVVAAEHGGAFVGLPIRVHERRVVAERGREVGHHLERLELDLDERGCGARDLGRGRRDSGHDVTLEADGVAREEPPVLHHAAVEEVGDVLVRHDGDHARERARLGSVDPRNPRVRMVGVAERRVELAREREVGRVPARARHLLQPVGPDEALGALLDGGHGGYPTTPGLPAGGRYSQAP